MNQKELMRFSILKAAPVICSYIFLGTAYGILMQEAGFPWYLPLFISLTVYTGAFQFVFTTLLAAGASILTIAVTAFLMNSRQTFYSLTFVDAFNRFGKSRPYMIHTLTDETYAVNCTLTDLPEAEKKKVMLRVATFSYISWMLGATLGAVLGQLIPFSTEGIDYCMTALFIIIFVDQWEKAKVHLPALAGIAVGIVCLFLFGEDRFMLPALLIVSAILVLYDRLSGKEANKA